MLCRAYIVIDDFSFIYHCVLKPHKTSEEMPTAVHIYDQSDLHVEDCVCLQL